MVKIEYFGITDVGKKRSNNEDNFYVNGYYKADKNALRDKCSGEADQAQFLFSVCDGMGGTQLGEEASLDAVSMLSKYNNTDFSVSLKDYIKQTNDKICSFRTATGKSAGTTFTSLFIKDGFAETANIGDSRIYMYRDNILKQISYDHTEAQTMVDEGILDAHQAKKSAAFHVLTQHFGIYEDDLIIEPFVAKTRIENGDIFLMCSDGLTDMLEDYEIEKIIGENMSTEDICNSLLNSALSVGGKDNITILAVRVINIDNITENNNYLKPDKKLSQKKIIAVILCVVLLFAIGIFSFNSLHKNKTVNSDAMIELRTPPMLINDIPYVSMKELYGKNNLNMEITWDESSATMTASFEQMSIVVQAKKDSLIRNINNKQRSESLQMDAEAFVIDGELYVPLNALAGAVGCNTVIYDEQNKSCTLQGYDLYTNEPLEGAKIIMK